MVVVLAICFAGCTEKTSSGAADSRAMLIANENIELKSQLKQKDKEIAKQKELLAECQKEKAELKKQLLEKTTKEDQKLIEQLVEAMEKEKKTEK